MEKLVQPAADFLSQSLTGVVIFGLGLAVYYLWRSYERVQDARIADLKILVDTARDLAETKKVLIATFNGLTAAGGQKQ